MGRTGKLFVIEHFGIVPDLITTAKSLGAGMPISAVTGRAEMMDAPHRGGVGGTYGGNPLACVAAIEAVHTIRQTSFLRRAEAIGPKLKQTLLGWKERFPLINTDQAVFSIGREYYCAYAGVWYVSNMVYGPFEVATSVPRELIDAIPPEKPAL